MRRFVPFFALAIVLIAATGAAVAATAPQTPSAEISVLDALRGVPVTEPADVVAPAPCQDQICHYVESTGGNPAHYNCATQTNSKCKVDDPPTTCSNGICRTPKTTTGAVEAGEL